MIRAGKLDRTITIERSTETIDAAGVPVVTWATLATMRAELTEASTDETIVDSGASTDTTVTFRTRFLDGVTVADRVTYAGRAFNLKGIRELGRRRGLELRTERVGP